MYGRPGVTVLAALTTALAAMTLTTVGATPAAAMPGARDGVIGSAQPLPPGGGESYSLLTSTGALLGFGAAFGAAGPAKPSSPAVGVAPTADGQGAFIAESDGTVFTRGDAQYHGSEPPTALIGQVVGIAADSATGGYWLATDLGAVYAFDAPDYGSAIKIDLNHPIVGISAAPGGVGYRLVASDGGIFTFGTAPFLGSTGGIHLKRPIVGMATNPAGTGYWLVASDGGVFTFGKAKFYGSTGAIRLNKPIVALADTTDGGGYWMVASDGGVFTFGDSRFFGSAAATGDTISGIALETGGYVNPLRGLKHLVAERIDQGVDYAGSGPIYAIGDGVVLNTTNAGWPGGGFITYQLSDGRAKGDIVYVAENVAPLVRVGEQVTPSTVLGQLIDSYPNLETGWAAPPGNGESLARASGQWSSYDDAHNIPTAYGKNFSQLLWALSAPAGIADSKTTSGTVPPSWPRWSKG